MAIEQNQRQEQGRTNVIPHLDFFGLCSLLMAGRKGRKAARMMEPAAIYPSAKKIPCLYLKAGQRREQQGWVTVNRDDPKFQTKQKFDSVSGERKPNWVDISLNTITTCYQGRIVTVHFCIIYHAKPIAGSAN